MKDKCQQYDTFRWQWSKSFCPENEKIMILWYLSNKVLRFSESKKSSRMYSQNAYTAVAKFGRRSAYFSSRLI
jgi:hypothetical protein